jgi:23S rRNA pseudouridine1911/1915/1917 synthase
VQAAVGAIDAAIGRSPRNRKKMAIVPDGRGKTALTRFRVLRRFGAVAALLECRLATGRTHQIRVHLSAEGHPLIGDRAYGGAGAGRLAGAPSDIRDEVAAFPRQALHANLLGFLHPASGAAMRFESALPADLEALIKALERL